MDEFSSDESEDEFDGYVTESSDLNDSAEKPSTAPWKESLQTTITPRTVGSLYPLQNKVVHYNNTNIRATATLDINEEVSHQDSFTDGIAHSIDMRNK